MSATPRALVWDLDGTLIDSAPDICRALNSTLVESGHHALGEDEVRLMIGDGVAKLVERGFNAVGAPHGVTGIVEAVEQFMVHYSANPAGLTRLYPGAATALAEVAALGIRQGICTNKPEAVSRAVLRDLGVDRYFDAIVGGDTTPVKKPDPLPLERCLDGLGAGASEAVMIGDSAVDVAMARTLDIPVGLVTFGYARSDVRTLGADFLIEDLGLVPGLIDSIFNTRKAAC